VAGTVSAALLALLLVRSRAVQRPMWPALYGAVALVFNAVSGRATFGLGLMFGLAGALGVATGYARNLPTANDLGELRLPRLADTPDITVELIASNEAPGGVSELAVPPVAPALANALASATGRRFRSLPLT